MNRTYFVVRWRETLPVLLENGQPTLSECVRSQEFQTRRNADEFIVKNKDNRYMWMFQLFRCEEKELRVDGPTVSA